MHQAPTSKFVRSLKAKLKISFFEGVRGVKTNTGRYPLMCAILPLMLYAENHFVSPTQGVLNFETVVQEISAFMESEHGRSYKLIVGTDSRASAGSAQFVSVIIIHRIGTCARYFWTKGEAAHMASLRQRIYQEATLSLGLAQRLTQGVGEVLNGYLTDGTCQLEVHVDIGHFGPTRDMIREIVGMILGNGFTVKIKPESYAASSVADRHV